MVETLTPMMRQYRDIRRGLAPDTILFFRLGDFYEMFFEDAVEAAGILEITLTKRHEVPMCGVPYHAAEQYLARLIRAGRKVAICEQTEDPSAAKGIVRRAVTRVVTPGTVLEESALEATRNNWLAALLPERGGFGLALLDLSTGTFLVEEVPDWATLRGSLMQYAPVECVLPERVRDDPELQRLLREAGVLPTLREEWTFEAESACDVLLRHFKLHSLDGFGCGSAPLGVRAAGAVLYYVSQDLRRDPAHVRTLRVKHSSDYLMIDETTATNLELLEPLNPGRRESGTTLFEVLNQTRTAMGGRLLRDWLIRPLRRVEEINRRQEAVAAFAADRLLLNETREFLKGVRDLERLTARLQSGGQPRDLLAVAQSLEHIPELKKLIHPSIDRSVLLAELEAQLVPLPELLDLIRRAVDDTPAATLKEGGVIRPGYHPQLDELRAAAGQGKQWLADFQQREAERTGIKSLKVRHNKVFGYYIEISKSNLALAPEDYIRKQTLVNAERFITPELKEYENKIFGAQERATALELELFEEVRQAVLRQTEPLQRNAAAVARLDVLSTFAERALSLQYCRPVMTETDTLRIVNGRHPVIEQMPGAERFVPNDTLLNCTTDQLMIITGPNMAGKSTYIRQVALIAILAHTGAFVPAEAAEIGVTDRVFTRVGASDDLARGRSTFMVEMQETANILNNATPRSLIVLDEIGRGTSTFDGISIAWSVAEFLCRRPEIKARTLFATHYHELTDLALTVAGVKNFNVLVRESGDRITFLRKIVPGGADKSYGIQVARLAGLPEAVIQRAREILDNLEEGEFGEGGQPRLAKHTPRRRRAQENQMELL